MPARIETCCNGTWLVIASPEDAIEQIVGGSTFPVLLPAITNEDCIVAERLVVNLLRLGCIEFCRVGNLAPELHDKIDEVLEEMGLTNVITTWHEDMEDAADYFLFASVPGAKLRVAFGAHEPGIITALLDRCAGND